MNCVYCYHFTNVILSQLRSLEYPTRAPDSESWSLAVRGQCDVPLVSGAGVRTGLGLGVEKGLGTGVAVTGLAHTGRLQHASLGSTTMTQ